jgi:hypothetical protein
VNQLTFALRNQSQAGGNDSRLIRRARSDAWSMRFNDPTGELLIDDELIVLLSCIDGLHEMS